MGVYEELGVRRVINAAGSMTTLGGSLVDPEVLEAMNQAARSFVYMDQLMEKAGDIITQVTGAEAGIVTSGAAAGLVLAAAACMTGTDLAKMRQLPDTTGLKDEVIVQRQHRIPFDQAIRTTGAKFVEVGDVIETYPWEIEAAINEKTAAIFYVVLDPQPGTVPLEEVIEIAKSKAIPVIVDAAAELPPVENLKKFIAMGADLVTFSGGKAIEAPNDTGILCGRRDLIKACTLQAFPNFGIGRPMKISKEQIVGFIVALQRYVRKDHKAEMQRWDAMAKYMLGELRDLLHVEARIVFPERGPRPLCIPRVQLSLYEKDLGLTVADVVNALRKGEPAVEVWPVPTFGTILLNPQHLLDGEERIVVQRLREVLT